MKTAFVLLVLTYFILLYVAFVIEVCRKIKKENEILKRKLGDNYYWLLEKNRITVDNGCSDEIDFKVFLRHIGITFIKPFNSVYRALLKVWEKTRKRQNLNGKLVGTKIMGAEEINKIIHSSLVGIMPSNKIAKGEVTFAFGNFVWEYKISPDEISPIKTMGNEDEQINQ